MQSRGNYINGRFVAPDAEQELVSINPATGACLGRVAASTAAVGLAVEAAKRAQPAWAQQPVAARVAAVRALAEVLSARGEELAVCISREMGKPVWEARTEINAATGKIEISINAGLDLVREVRLEDGSGYDYRPHGVLAVLGPFNFPIHLMHGHVIPGLLLGNSVVLKPSEHTPFCGQIYAEIFDSAGLPAGVFNLVQGAAPVGAALAAHEQVNAVLFTGSYAAGVAISKANVTQPGKLLALEMGGKNPAIVLPDAPLDKALHDVAWGAYVTSGQRCSGTGLCFVERSIYDGFVSRLSDMLSGIQIGDPSSDVFMGPLAFAAARDKLERSLAQAVTAGAKRVATSACPEGAAFAPATLHEVRDFDPEDPYIAEEIFGPDLAVVPVDSLQQAIAHANSLPYGLSASVFTADAARFEHARTRLEYGCINHNAPTCGASSKLPFGGLKRSGNHRPAALWSSLYCAYPVASIRGPSERGKLSPGLNW